MGYTGSMIKAIIFDCFGVIITDAPPGAAISGEVKDRQLLAYILDLRQSYKIAMLSNVGKGGFRQRFTDEELTAYFDTVVLSGEIGYAKPEAEAYEITADRLSVRFEDCFFTDDREPFCEAARAIGMQAVHYQNFNQFRQDLEGVLNREYISR